METRETILLQLILDELVKLNSVIEDLKVNSDDIHEVMCGWDKYGVTPR